MTVVKLKGVHRKVAKGHVYYTAWRGGPRIHAPFGTPEFLAEYLSLTRKLPEAGTMESLVAAYKGSESYRKIADSTRRVWGPWLDQVRDGLGKMPMTAFDKPEVKQVIKKWRNRWKDRPRTADTAKQVLSAILSYGVEEGLLTHNQSFGIPNLYSSDRSEIIWTEADVARLCAVASPEVAWALRLACLTGLRKGDLLALEWGHVFDLSIDMNTSKSRGRRVAVIPIYAELRALLAEIPRRAATVLTNSGGEPWRGFGASWTKARHLAGGLDHLHFHDARGTAATRFYVAGFPPEEIAEILAWEKAKVARIINRYVRRDALLLAKIARMDAASKNG